MPQREEEDLLRLRVLDLVDGLYPFLVDLLGLNRLGDVHEEALLLLLGLRIEWLGLKLHQAQPLVLVVVLLLLARTVSHIQITCIVLGV